MKRVFKILIGIVAIFFIVAVIGMIGQSIEGKKETKEKTKGEQLTEETVTDEPEEVSEPVTETTAETTTEPVTDSKAEAEANATKYPATAGKKLYDNEFKGMQYHFHGALVKTESVESVTGKMEKALLVKNDSGYVLVIFPPYEIDASEGDEIEAWGPLSGDGYASRDLGVDNVVGVTGAMNATVINVNGEQR